MNNTAQKTTIETAQLQQLLAINHRTLATSTLIALMLAYTQRHVIAAQIILTWLLLSVFFNVLRVITVAYYRRNPAKDFETTLRRLTQYRIGVLISGVIWAYASYTMFPIDNFKHQMFLVFMLTGVSVGGVIAYSVDRISALTFTIFIFVPILIRLWLAGDEVSLMMSFAGSLYLIYLIVSINNINRNLIENITLHIDAVQREQEMFASEERYRLLLNHSPVGISHYDTNLVATYCNQHFADILHCSVDDVINKPLTILKDESILPTLNKAIAGEVGSYQGRYHAAMSDAEGWMNLITAPAQDGNGNVVGGIAIVQDITDQKQAADEIKQLAFYDPLTNLPNRRLLFDRLDQALIMSVRTGRRGALLFLDLDHFKKLNDTLGHDVGDLLLKQVAARLLLCVRESDTVARLGGDEFIVMLVDLSSIPAEAATQVDAIGNQIIMALNQPYNLNDQEYRSTASIGVAMFGDHGKSHMELLKHADIAMYQAKKAGRNMVHHFESNMRDSIN